MCKQLNGVALWGRRPFLIRTGDNNELVCPELITDSRLFSFPIHTYQATVNGQWHLLVIIMFAYSVDKMFLSYLLPELQLLVSLITVVTPPIHVVLIGILDIIIYKYSLTGTAC